MYTRITTYLRSENSSTNRRIRADVIDFRYMRLFFKLLCIFSLTIITSSCFQESKDIKEAKKLLEAKQHSQAIELLNQYDSTKSKELNSKIHLDYSLKILADLKQEKELRYLNAKENLRKALDLDPENNEAKVFYKMLSKTIEREFPSDL